MYDLVYKEMGAARLLEELDEPVWMDLEGEVVATEAEAVGEKVTHDVKHPDYMLFVDEVGNNTNMKDDGNVGGEKLHCWHWRVCHGVDHFCRTRIDSRTTTRHRHPMYNQSRRQLLNAIKPWTWQAASRWTNLYFSRERSTSIRMLHNKRGDIF
mmetsp:Transcript_25354/g.42136  ORF Transcript_25354/g.42136 Transcript_25354/m.42136 type:complete len:154 (+) Transcript_25354:120-581(+)